MIKQPTILIIDDEKTIRDSFAMYLEDYGYQIRVAENGRVGLEMFEQEHPDLVLVDLRMPEIGGIEVLSRISKELSPHTPLIVFSGTGNITDAIIALRSGAWDYVLKPVEDLSILIYRIEESLEKARLIQENQNFQENLLQMVAEKTQELTESEKRFRTIAENIPGGTLIVGTDRHIRDVNAATCKLTGYTRDELIGQPCDIICPSESTLNGCLVWKNEQDDFRGIYTTLKTKDKGERIIIKNISKIEFEGKTWILENFQDITKRIEMEKQLHRQEQLAAVGQLASGIAHDFRNLLSTIILYAQLSQRLPDLPQTLTENLENIVNESYKATDLIQQILDFSSRSIIKQQPLDLSAFTNDVLDILKRVIPENIHLNLKTGPQTYIVNADSGRMQQAITNLAINSRDAMPEGGALSFTFSRIETIPEELPPVADMPPGKWVYLTVSDTGIGMTEEVQKHLFEPFFTTKNAEEGTGLGLAQVYGIIRLHKGFIRVESELGTGTTFHIYLPLYEKKTEEKDAKAKETSHTPLLGQGETILLAEDKATLREASQSLLESLGYQVLTAKDGDEALTICQSHQVDLVITDLIMPKMGGKELAIELMKILPQLKVLIITGHALRADDINSFQKTNFAGIIHKPFTLDNFSQIVGEALGKGR
ncbi:MAG: hypothetical protein DRI56_04185 [Chloroflexota bacterium]|nr:MAG: hypothetical protein DRI56_04185 [Chloroflexota bacterium]